MTVAGIVFESRLPRLFMGAYSPKITEGLIGVAITTDPEKIQKAEDVLKKCGAEEITNGQDST